MMYLIRSRATGNSTETLEMLGRGNVSERYSAEVNVRGEFAYTNVMGIAHEDVVDNGVMKEACQQVRVCVAHVYHHCNQKLRGDMSQDLDSRVNRFARFPKPDIKVSDLIYQYRLAHNEDFMELQHSCMLYMCKSAQIPYTPSTEEVLDYYVNNRDKLKHVTPNGLMVPKRHASLEFNLVAQCFYRMLDKIGCFDLIRSWNVPLNMRIKFGPASKDHMERKFASEHIHSDAWVGENKDCGTAMLFIAGDAPHNTVNFYHPSGNFSSEWLVSHDSYKDASGKFMDNYAQVPCDSHVGDLLMSDFATLHNSRADEGCGPRVSIDSTFSYMDVAEADHWRGDRADLDTIREVGTRYFFFFPHRVDDKVDSEGSKKQAVNLKIVDMM